MNGEKLNKAVSEKIKFIFQKIMSGVLLWIVLSAMISYQKYIVDHITNALLSVLLYLMPGCMLVWFCSVGRNKNKWKPFGAKSELIGSLMIVLVIVILYLMIGILKVIV